MQGRVKTMAKRWPSRQDGGCGAFDEAAMDVEAPAAANNRAGKLAVSNRSKPRTLPAAVNSSEQPGDALTRRDVLKASALGALGAWESLADTRPGEAKEGPPAQEPVVNSVNVPLVFDEPAGRLAGSITWPVTVGVPFANGALATLDDLSVFGAEAAVPTQISRALDWRFGAKTVSWVHCDFQATFGGGANPTASLRRAPAALPERAVKVIDRGASYEVQTGAISFIVSKTAFNLFDSFSAGDTRLVSSSSLYWIDTQGNAYESKYVVDRVEVEKSGPMRAVIRYDGWYKAASSAKKLRYSVWLHAFAGLPYVRIYDKLIWTENLTLYVSIDTATGQLSTRSLFADRNGVSTFVAHGWSSGDAVRFKYSHSDVDLKGANQYYDNTMTQGRELVVLPKVEGPALARDVNYYVHVVNETTLTLHRRPADAQSGASPIKFLDRGVYSRNGVSYVGRHYLQAQSPVLGEWGIKFNLAEQAARASVDVAGAASPSSYQLASAMSVTAEQSAHGSASLATGNGSTTEVGPLAGWAEARFAGGAGLAVAVKGMAEQCPKSLHIDGTSVTVKLWGGAPMSLAEEDRVLPAYDESGYPKEWLAFSGEANPVGISKTHEIWVWPAGQVANDRLVNDVVQRPIACCADPAHACASDYILGVRPASRTPSEYGYVEAALENILRYLTTRDGTQGDYDEWNFGDLRLFRGGPFRTWDNGGYNCTDLFWWQFYRTGKRFFLEEGIHTARHTMDVDTIAHSQSTSGGYDDYLRIAGRAHFYATLQWAWTAPRGDEFTDHPWYLLLCWLMTGYEVARTVLETKCTERKAAGYGDPGELAGYPLGTVTREQYGAIMPKFVYHEFTGDPHFYAAGRKLLELAINAQAATSETNSRGTRLFPNNNFLGFFYEAFLYCYRYASESQVLAALAQTVDDFAAGPTNQYDAPTWACTWPLPSRQVRARNSLATFAAAYKQSGNAQYLAYPIDKILRQCRTIQSSGPQLGYDTIQGTLAPAFLRDAILLLGVWADAGLPPISWPGNMPLFASQTILAFPWVSQLTLWAQKPVGAAGNVRLIFKDANLTNLEAPGRMQAVVLGPAGRASTIPLTSDVAYPVRVAGGVLSLAGGHNLAKGQPVRLKSTGKLPSPLAADGTYFVHAASSGAAAVSIHSTFGEAVAGTSPLRLSGGSGALSLLAAKTLSETTFALPATDPAGTYRIHIQGECQLFRATPASDMPGLVVELPAGELVVDATFGPAEYHFRMHAGHRVVTLSTLAEKCNYAQPVAVLDLDRRKIGGFDYDGGETLSASLAIPAPQVAGVLKLAKGYEEFSPPELGALPLLDLDGAERHIAVTPSQWFSPLVPLNRAIAAFWSLKEAEGVRRDVTANGRNLSENHGPIEGDRLGHVGAAARFDPPGNSWLSSTDPVFQATGSFTIWGWASLANVKESRYLFVKGGDIFAVPNSCEWAVYELATSTRRLFFQARVGKRFAFTPPLNFPADDKMHLIVAWHDAASRRIMLQIDDGGIVSQSLPGPINVGSQQLAVGGCGANGHGWVGRIAAVGFAKAALSAVERNLLYNGGAGLQYPF
jgi:hypothetical protein